MKTKMNEFTIGLSVSLAAAIIIFSILWLGKSNFLVKGFPLNMVVENANGITSGDEVFFRGLKVGTITGASVGSKGVLLKLKIDGVNKIPVDSKFTIGNLSLISGTAVEITPGISTRYFEPNDTVYGYPAYGLDRAIAGLQKLEDTAGRVLTNVDEITGIATRRKIDSTLNDMNRLVADLNVEVNGSLKRTLANTDRITAENKEKIALLVASLSQNSRELSSFLKKSSSSEHKIDSLLDGLNSGRGSLGRILKSDTLYDGVKSAITSIDSLVVDIRKNPKKYINVSVF